MVNEWIEKRDAHHVALHDGHENQQRSSRNQTRDENFLETIENAKEHLRLVRLGTMTSPSRQQFPD